MAQYAYRPPGYPSSPCSCLNHSCSSSSSSSSSCSCGLVRRKINPDAFYAWTKPKLYETTYQAVHNRGSPERKNGIIPGYAGYIPGEKAKAFYAKNDCKIAKEAFNDPNLGQNKLGLSTTGFNLRREALVDPTVVATTHKYGAVTQQKNHPAVDAKDWVTHVQDTYQNPYDVVPPTHRPDFAPTVKHGPVVDLSGFGVNANTFDGRNEFVHVPDKVEERQNRRATEYRVRYNTKKPFHPNPTIFKPRLLEKQRNPLNIN